MTRTLWLRIVEGQDQIEVEGLMNADKVGDVRDGEWAWFFFFFSPLSAGRWPLAQRYEENVTQHYPLSLLQTQMKFYFLCHTVERKQFLLLLINVWYMGRAQEGCKIRYGGSLISSHSVIQSSVTFWWGWCRVHNVANLETPVQLKSSVVLVNYSP